MTAIVHRKRLFLARPAPATIPGVSLRNYRGEDDIARWLWLRERAFARQKVGIRQWDADDFRREFLDKPWWRPEWMWFAVTDKPDSAMLSDEPVGTVTLALRQSAAATVAVVHWLCVLPAWRRRGVGRLLMNAVEQAAWDAGYREVSLETHEAWREAAAAYDALGYKVVKSTQA